MSRIENRVVVEGSRVLIKYLPHTRALFYLTLLLILPDKKVFEHSLRREERMSSSSSSKKNSRGGNEKIYGFWAEITAN